MAFKNNGSRMNDVSLIRGTLDYSPEDPVAAKIYSLYGRFKVPRTKEFPVLNPLRELMIQRKMPRELYKYLSRSSEDELYKEVDALSVSSEQRNPEEQRIVEESYIATFDERYGILGKRLDES